MKTAKTLAIAAMLPMLTIAQPGVATAGPRGAKAKVRRGAKARRRPVQQPAELRCHIEAFSDAAGTESIPDRSSVVNADAIWLRFSVRNVGGLPAEPFQNDFRVSSGSNTEESDYELTLLPGFSVTSPLIETRLSSGSGLTAVLEIDTDNDVPERDEVLNHCMFQVRNEKLH